MIGNVLGSKFRNIMRKIGCPDGVFHPLDIDAKINAAYIVLGLLYGNGDFTKTMEISTRAGQFRIQIVIRLLQEDIRHNDRL